MLYLLSLALPLIIANNADAQRPNHTKKDMSTEIEKTYDKIKNNVKEDFHNIENKIEHHKDKKHHKNKFKSDEHDIEKDYRKAIKKIKKSDFTDEQKKLLRQQAEENRNLAIEQLKERQKMMNAHKEDIMKDEAFEKAIKTEKANRKAIKEIKNILN